MILDKLYKKYLIQPPKFLLNNTIFVTQMGSEAYGCASNESDIDVYGVCVPYRQDVFPHLRNEIVDFGTQKQRFNVWQQHNVEDHETKKEYDFSVYSIVKYFHLALTGSPNIIDSLFVPRRCILHSTLAGEIMRDNRKLFLSKKLYWTLKGYAFSQKSKINNKINYKNEKRAKDIEEFGYSTKYLLHLVRLLDQCTQIMVEHDLDLERNREQLKAIRKGEWKFDDIDAWFTEKEKVLENLYATSTLQHSCDEEKIKGVLLNCLEQHWGTLENAIKKDISVDKIIFDLESIIEKYKAGD